MIIAGDLRHNITVERLTSTKDSFGSPNSTYTLHLTLKAGIKFNAGNRTIDNSEIFNTKTLQVTTYYRDIVETDRIVFEGKYYKINDISPIGYKDGLIINCELINK